MRLTPSKRAGTVRKFLLRIEAVNFAPFVLDNSDLSTVRGGSLLLLDAAKWAGSQLGKNVTTVSQGASTGLYEIEATDDCEARDLARNLSRRLDEHPLYRHATFVTSLAKADEPEGVAHATVCESATAVARWRQMQQPTVMVRDAATDWHKSIGSGGDDAMKPLDENAAIDRDNRANDGREAKRIACAIDHLRPAHQWIEGTGIEVKRVSASTAVRNANGRHQKRRFYECLFEELGIEANTPSHFALEFSQIATVPNKLASFHGDIARLHGKFAVIYLDGNRFGKTMREHCTDVAKHQAWDEALRHSRAQFIAKLFDTIEKPSSNGQSFWHFHGRSAHRLQLETLLWGGDEIIWVVPAWQGWQFLCRFFQEWQFPPPESENDSFLRNIGNLSHAAGVVFCNHKAPIHRTTDLVKSLGDAAKEVARDQNLVGYEVLESFDHTGQDFRAYRESRSLLCPPPAQQPANAAETVGQQMQQERMRRRARAARGSGNVRNLDQRSRARTQPMPADVAQGTPRTRDNKARDPGRLVLNLAEMRAVDELCFRLKACPDFPRGKMRSLVLEAFAEEARHEALKKKADQILGQAGGDAEAAVGRSLEAFQGDSLRLLHHACELWDYVGLSHQWTSQQ